MWYKYRFDMETFYLCIMCSEIVCVAIDSDFFLKLIFALEFMWFSFVWLKKHMLNMTLLSQIKKYVHLNLNFRKKWSLCITQKLHFLQERLFQFIHSLVEFMGLDGRGHFQTILHFFRKKSFISNHRKKKKFIRWNIIICSSLNNN